MQEEPEPEEIVAAEDVPVAVEKPEEPELEEIVAAEDVPVAVEKQEEPEPEEVAAAEDTVASVEEEKESDQEEDVLRITDFPEGELKVAPEIGNQKESFVAFRADDDSTEQIEEEDIIGADEIEEEPVPLETSAEDDIPFYDPSADRANRDVVISDEEIKSVREYIEREEPRPEFIVPEEKPEGTEPESVEAVYERPAPVAQPDEPYQLPVQLEEIQELKKKIFELHEKQEILSSKVTGMLGDIKAAIDGPAKQETAPVEELSTDELEDIIFIGRKKG